MSERPMRSALLDACIAMAGILGTAHGPVAVAQSRVAAAETPVSRTRAERLFEEGLTLASANRTAAAIAVFSRLTREYPRLPQPHEQLATLYARQKDLEKASQSLQNALRLRTGALLQRQSKALCEQQGAEAERSAPIDLCPAFSPDPAASSGPAKNAEKN